jgi:hypothetical protein
VPPRKITSAPPDAGAAPAAGDAAAAKAAIITALRSIFPATLVLPFCFVFIQHERVRVISQKIYGGN